MKTQALSGGAERPSQSVGLADSRARSPLHRTPPPPSFAPASTPCPCREIAQNDHGFPMISKKSINAQPLPGEGLRVENASEPAGSLPPETGGGPGRGAQTSAETDEFLTLDECSAGTGVGATGKGAPSRPRPARARARALGGAGRAQGEARARTGGGHPPLFCSGDSPPRVNPPPSPHASTWSRWRETPPPWA